MQQITVDGLAPDHVQEKGRSRYDFDTEEQWTEYKSAKEANPKAAFQFGVKMSEGRKAHKDLGKSRDQKISNQMGKIKNILEKDVRVLAMRLPACADVCCCCPVHVNPALATNNGPERTVMMLAGW